MMDRETYRELRRALSERSWAQVNDVLKKHEVGPNNANPDPNHVRDFSGHPGVPPWGDKWPDSK